MNIIVGLKVTPEAQDIEARPDRSLNFERAGLKIGAYDLNAIEAGCQLAAATSGQVKGISVGGDALANSKVRKDILSRGLDELITVSGEGFEDLDSYQTASLLAQNIGPDVDLVLVGAGSSDQYTQQVGNQLGALLGWSCLNAVNQITPGDGVVTVERVLEDGVQVITVSLPAVLSLTSAINTPRIPSMKDILAAGKKAVQEISGLSVPAAAVEAGATLAPEQVSRRQQLVEADPAEAAAQLAQFLKTL